jgi:hypothetical protein
VAAEAKKALKKHEASHRRQAKESKRKATVRQKAAQATTRFETPPPEAEEGESIVVRTPQTPVAAAAVPSPPKEDEKSPLLEKRKEAPPPSPAKNFNLVLDTSILNEAPQYSSAAPAAEDPAIMAPPMEVEPHADAAPMPRTVPSPTTPSNLQKEYIAALHQRAKVTYSSGGRSIKRKAEDESPEHAVHMAKKKDAAAAVVVPGGAGGADGTTFDNLRKVSLGLRVRGNRGPGGGEGGVVVGGV